MKSKIAHKEELNDSLDECILTIGTFENRINTCDRLLSPHPSLIYRSDSRGAFFRDRPLTQKTTTNIEQIERNSIAEFTVSGFRFQTVYCLPLCLTEIHIVRIRQLGSARAQLASTVITHFCIFIGKICLLMPNLLFFSPEFL